MNFFRLDDDPPEAAKLHADHHVRKMPTEACQLLATAHIKPQADGYDEMTPQQRLAADLLPYNHTHVNHPCAIWVRSGLDNYMWGLALAAALIDEFRYRFGRRHATADVVAWLSRNVPARLPPGSTTPPQAMPEELRGDDAVAAYRRYYAAEKQGYWVGERWVVSKWTRRDVPWFMLDSAATMR
jgi:hypothetical protein